MALVACAVGRDADAGREPRAPGAHGRPAGLLLAPCSWRVSRKTLPSPDTILVTMTVMATVKAFPASKSAYAACWY
jgi:hypothetical protein